MIIVSFNPFKSCGRWPLKKLRFDRTTIKDLRVLNSEQLYRRRSKMGETAEATNVNAATYAVDKRILPRAKAKNQSTTPSYPFDRPPTWLGGSMFRCHARLNN
jgi:hypothetical protein